MAANLRVAGLRKQVVHRVFINVRAQAGLAQNFEITCGGRPGVRSPRVFRTRSWRFCERTWESVARRIGQAVWWCGVRRCVAQVICAHPRTPGGPIKDAARPAAMTPHALFDTPIEHVLLHWRV